MLTKDKRFATTFLLWLFCFYTIPLPFLFLLSLRIW
nr:MAG TPA: hypothetical protein [Bacteriophage sp.]